MFSPPHRLPLALALSTLTAASLFAQPAAPSGPASSSPEAGATATSAPANAGMQFATRPVADNDTTLRPLSPEEIPPNLNFYAIDPLYRPNRPLGWATERIEEKIDRGLVVLPAEGGKVYLSWRLLKSDTPDTAFNVYRSAAGATPTKLNAAPIVKTTDFIDTSAPASGASWTVRAVVSGRELEASPAAIVAAVAPSAASTSATPTTPANSSTTATPTPVPSGPPAVYRALKLKEDVTSISMVAIGDLNGDGVYDFVVKHPGGGKDPGRIQVSRGTYKFDGYDGKTGQFLWRIDLGWNVDMGIWWTPLIVRDLDGDNKAEICLRTKPYAATLEEALPGARAGNALEGPEWLSVYNGETGQLIDQVDWIELGKVQDWGDNTGNRASRHLMAVAYLDGKTPAVLAARGTYGMMKVDAWVLKNRKLEKVWRWTNERAPFMYQGQGQHSIRVGDIDGDGCDEIINGSLAIDNDGRTLWTTGLGHGDRFYLTDIDPSNPGLEIAYIIEEPHPQLGLNVRRASNADLLFGAREPNQDNAIDQMLVGDIDPRYPGMEVWANKGLKQLFYSAKGEPIPGPVPTTSELVWWDGDLLREQLSTFNFGGRGGRGPGNPATNATSNATAATAAPGAATTTENNPQVLNALSGFGVQPGARSIGKWKNSALSPITPGITGAVHQVADILGDWREEIVTFVNGELRIYSTTIPAADRRVCLMQDPIYRHDVTLRTMGYPHTPQVSYFLGEK